MLQTIDWQARAKSAHFPNRPFIDGAYVDSLSGETFPCIYPGDGRLLIDVASCNDADVDVAVKSARKAFNSGVWSRMAPADRRRILLKFSELILTNREELALLETLNVGKPITVAFVDWRFAVSNAVGHADIGGLMPNDNMRMWRTLVEDRLILTRASADLFRRRGRSNALRAPPFPAPNLGVTIPFTNSLPGARD